MNATQEEVTPTCPTCDGGGEVDDGDGLCRTCYGSGLGSAWVPFQRDRDALFVQEIRDDGTRLHAGVFLEVVDDTERLAARLNFHSAWQTRAIHGPRVLVDSYAYDDDKVMREKPAWWAACSVVELLQLEWVDENRPEPLGWRAVVHSECETLVMRGNRDAVAVVAELLGTWEGRARLSKRIATQATWWAVEMVNRRNEAAACEVELQAAMGSLTEEELERWAFNDATADLDRPRVVYDGTSVGDLR